MNFLQMESIVRPMVTVVVPSYNQGAFLDEALASIFDQKIPMEVFVLDGGSSDNSLAVIQRWEYRLAGWRSREDDGQAASINEGVALGSAPFVCWLNSDDLFLPGALLALLSDIEGCPEAPAVYGRVWHMAQETRRYSPVWVEPFDEARLALRCIISQPGTLIRRTAWDLVGGVDCKLHMALDYDLWWRLFKKFGPLKFVESYVAVNRVHDGTKTKNFRYRHYSEAIAVVKKYHGRVPLKWWLAQPYAVWFKSIFR